MPKKGSLSQPWSRLFGGLARTIPGPLLKHLGSAHSGTCENPGSAERELATYLTQVLAVVLLQVPGFLAGFQTLQGGGRRGVSSSKAKPHQKGGRQSQTHTHRAGNASVHTAGGTTHCSLKAQCQTPAGGRLKQSERTGRFGRTF